MELESTNLIYTRNLSQLELPLAFSFGKDIKIFIKFFRSTIGLINAIIIFILFITFLFNNIKKFLNPLELKCINGTSKDLVNFYQDNIISVIILEIYIIKNSKTV